MTKPKHFLTHQYVIGLGNPGTNYEKTRHNAGFWILDRLAENLSIKFKKPFFKPYLQAYSSPMTLIKPLTYMNNSGIVLPKVIPNNLEPLIIIITDNMDLEPGRVRLKTKLGSGGGHNGIKSIIQSYGTSPWIMTLGIGRPRNHESIIDHVLGQPSQKEIPAISSGIEKAVIALELFMQGEIDGGIHALNQP